MSERKNPVARPVPSPCISVCVLDTSSGLCTGCLRSLDEIAEWGSMSDDAKRAVWAELPKRQAAVFTEDDRR